MLDELYKKNILIDSLKTCSSLAEAVSVRYQEEACKSASGNDYVCDSCPNHAVCDLTEHLERELFELIQFAERMTKL